MAGKIGNEDPVALREQRRELAPVPRGAAEPVHEDHRAPGACDEVTEAARTRLDDPLVEPLEGDCLEHARDVILSSMDRLTGRRN